MVSSLATSLPPPPPVTMTTTSPTSQAQSPYWRLTTGTSQVIIIKTCFLKEIYFMLRQEPLIFVDCSQFVVFI